METLLQQGEEMTQEEFAAYFLEHRHILFQHAMKLTSDANEAEELIQITYLQGTRKIHQLREKQACLAWLCTILRRTHINESIKLNRTVHFPLSEDGEEYPIEDRKRGLPHDPVLRRERNELLQKKMRTLSTMDSQTGALFYFEELPLKEISMRLQIPIGTVKRRLHTFRKRLKTLLEEANFGYEDLA